MCSIVDPMIRLQCPLERCADLEFPDDTAPLALAGAMCDHLAADGFFGDALIDRLAAVQVTREPATKILLTRIDRPLLAEDHSGKRHAIAPGLISADGRGPAACSSTLTVRIVMSALTERPVRATTRNEPGTVQPACVRCRKHI